MIRVELSRKGWSGDKGRKGCRVIRVGLSRMGWSDDKGRKGCRVIRVGLSMGWAGVTIRVGWVGE